MQLFPIILPKQHICNESALYYRTNDPVEYNETAGIITMHKNTILSLDTYFNCFSYSKYLQYTYAAILEVHLKVQGDVQLRIMKAELQNSKIYRTEKLAQTVHHEQLEEIVLQYDFSSEQGKGFLYLEVKALSQNVVIQFGYYSSPISAEQINQTNLAAVICTYKREEYVKRNLKHLTDTIFADKELQNHIEVLVIDNGKTLAKDDIEISGIKLYPNKNCGGSGGFTRGIIEALNRKKEFSHVLLMDDDILLESNVLVKTIHFLQVLRPEHADLALGGSMLRLDDMTVQHEAGGRWTGLTVDSRLSNIELRNIECLLQMECNTENADFCGWWYCCIPLKIISETNLPLPLFIKIDDIEYGIRNTKKLLFLNGIGVWHEPFSKKENVLLHYYNVRNKLILNNIRGKDCGIGKTMFLFAYYLGKILLSDQYYKVIYPLKGFEDYLKGPAWLNQQDMEQLHQQLILLNKQIDSQNKKPRAYYFIVAGSAFLKNAALLISKHKIIVSEYQMQVPELVSQKAWLKKLEIEV